VTDLPDERSYRAIGKLALPIIAVQIAQNLMPILDSMMVGRLGREAIAATSFGNFLSFLFAACFIGFSVGVQAGTARTVAEGRDRVAEPLTTGLVLTLAVSAVWSAVMWLTSGPVCRAVLAPSVADLATEYCHARALGLVPQAACMMFAGYLNGLRMPSKALAVSLATLVMNVALNRALIAGFGGVEAMGATGAGWARTLALLAAALLYLTIGLRVHRRLGLLDFVPSLAQLGDLGRRSLPFALERTFFMLGAMVYITLLGRIGTAALAVGSVLLNIMMLPKIASTGFGLAAVTVIAAPLSQGKRDEARSAGWRAVRLSSLFVVLYGIALLAFHERILGLFFHDPALVSLAIVPLLISGATLWVEFGIVYEPVLSGVGHGRFVLGWGSLLQWGFFLPVAYVLGKTLGGGLVAVWLTQLAYRVLHTTLFSVRWHLRATGASGS
jgi:putative MATE family efflux protein